MRPSVVCRAAAIRMNQNLTSFSRDSQFKDLSSNMDRLTSAPEHRRVAEHANQRRQLVSSPDIDSETVSRALCQECSWLSVVGMFSFISIGRSLAN